MLLKHVDKKTLNKDLLLRELSEFAFDSDDEDNDNEIIPTESMEIENSKAIEIVSQESTEHNVDDSIVEIPTTEVEYNDNEVIPIKLKEIENSNEIEIVSQESTNHDVDASIMERPTSEVEDYDNEIIQIESTEIENSKDIEIVSLESTNETNDVDGSIIEVPTTEAIVEIDGTVVDLTNIINNTIIVYAKAEHASENIDVNHSIDDNLIDSELPSTEQNDQNTQQIIDTHQIPPIESLNPIENHQVHEFYETNSCDSFSAFEIVEHEEIISTTEHEDECAETFDINDSSSNAATKWITEQINDNEMKPNQRNEMNVCESEPKLNNSKASNATIIGTFEAKSLTALLKKTRKKKRIAKHIVNEVLRKDPTNDIRPAADETMKSVTISDVCVLPNIFKHDQQLVQELEHQTASVQLNKIEVCSNDFGSTEKLCTTSDAVVSEISSCSNVIEAKVQTKSETDPSSKPFDIIETNDPEIVEPLNNFDETTEHGLESVSNSCIVIATTDKVSSSPPREIEQESVMCHDEKVKEDIPCNSDIKSILDEQIIENAATIKSQEKIPKKAKKRRAPRITLRRRKQNPKIKSNSIDKEKTTEDDTQHLNDTIVSQSVNVTEPIVMPSKIPNNRSTTKSRDMQMELVSLWLEKCQQINEPKVTPTKISEIHKSAMEPLSPSSTTLTTTTLHKFIDEGVSNIPTAHSFDPSTNEESKIIQNLATLTEINLFSTDTNEPKATETLPTYYRATPSTSTAPPKKTTIKIESIDCDSDDDTPLVLLKKPIKTYSRIKPQPQKKLPSPPSEFAGFSSPESIKLKQSNSPASAAPSTSIAAASKSSKHIITSTPTTIKRKTGGKRGMKSKLRQIEFLPADSLMYDESNRKKQKLSADNTNAVQQQQQQQQIPLRSIKQEEICITTTPECTIVVSNDVTEYSLNKSKKRRCVVNDQTPPEENDRISDDNASNTTTSTMAVKSKRGRKKKNVDQTSMVDLSNVTEFECGNCATMVKTKHWEKHLLIHYGLAWRVGIDPHVVSRVFFRSHF